MKVKIEKVEQTDNGVFVRFKCGNMVDEICFKNDVVTKEMILEHARSVLSLQTTNSKPCEKIDELKELENTEVLK